MNADCCPTGRIGGSDVSSTWPVSRRDMPLAANRVRSVAECPASGPVRPKGEITTMAANGFAARKAATPGPSCVTIRSAVATVSASAFPSFNQTDSGSARVAPTQATEAPTSASTRPHTAAASPAPT